MHATYLEKKGVDLEALIDQFTNEVMEQEDPPKTMILMIKSCDGKRDPKKHLDSNQAWMESFMMFGMQ